MQTTTLHGYPGHEFFSPRPCQDPTDSELRPRTAGTILVLELKALFHDLVSPFLFSIVLPGTRGSHRSTFGPANIFRRLGVDTYIGTEYLSIVRVPIPVLAIAGSGSLAGNFSLSPLPSFLNGASEGDTNLVEIN